MEKKTRAANSCHDVLKLHHDVLIACKKGFAEDCNIKNFCFSQQVPMQHFRWMSCTNSHSKQRRVLPTPSLIDFSPCEKVRMLFFFAFLSTILCDGNTWAARATWFSWKHKAWCTGFSHCCHQSRMESQDTPLSVCVALLESSRSGKIKHYKNPDNLSLVVVVKVSSVISIVETGGYSVVQCLWTEKLEKGRAVYDK